MSGRPVRPSNQRLERMAERIVTHVMRRLPEDLREAAQKCAVSFAWAEGTEEDPELLGFFEGRSLLESEPEGVEDMPQIRLFLDSLWEFSDRNVDTFEQEVAVTLLHELGHFLGLTEDEIEARGLG